MPERQKSAKKTLFRRSKSWKDLSSAMGFKAETHEAVPERTLKRTSSLNPGSRGRTRGGPASRMFDDFVYVGDIPSVEDQRAKERDFQRRASIKRKVVPSTERSSSSPPRMTQPHNDQPPRFPILPEALETGASSLKISHDIPQSMHSKSYSASPAGHSRMLSEMSVPMI